MADSDSAMGPQINDQYWFAYSKSLIEGALKSRDDAAATLQAFVGWLWTAYTAGAVIGVNLGKLSLEFLPSLLIGSPIIALVAVYWLTIWVRTPEVIQFDPRLPKNIEWAYGHNLLVKQRRLKITLVCTAVAGVLTAAAIIYASVASRGSVASELHVYTQVDHDVRAIFVDGAAPNVATVQLAVYELDSATGQRGRCLANEELTTSRGFFRAAPIQIMGPSTKAARVEITADLKESGSKLLVFKEIKF